MDALPGADLRTPPWALTVTPRTQQTAPGSTPGLHSSRQSDSDARQDEREGSQGISCDPPTTPPASSSYGCVLSSWDEIGGAREQRGT